MSTTEKLTKDRYDQVPYDGKPYMSTHPVWMATVAHLLSVPSTDPRKARVLEMGCCDGGNLIPMACMLPESSFVGLDISPVQIDMGKAVVSRLGLTNIDLRAASILDVTPDWGKFDYIIAHGVFSWIPPEVREKLMRICKENLSPEGVAYISYNAKPGWGARKIIRDLMQFHTARFEEPEKKIAEARSVLEFVEQNLEANSEPGFTAFVKTEAEWIRPSIDHYIYHEFLEPDNESFYFHEFISMARAIGLEYLAETSLPIMAPINCGEDAARRLSSMARNQIELEQYMDFLRNRAFRQTLLHHQGRPARYNIDPPRLAGLYVYSAARCQSKGIDLNHGVSVTFETPEGGTTKTSSGIVKAAMLCLMNDYPQAIEYSALLERARAEMRKVNVDASHLDRDAALLAGTFLKILISNDVICLSKVPFPFTIKPGERPKASPLARLQAERGRVVTTGMHNIFEIPVQATEVLKLLDGTRTIEEVAAELKIQPELAKQLVNGLARCALIIE